MQKLIKWALKLKFNKHFRIFLAQHSSPAADRMCVCFFTQWNFNECTEPNSISSCRWQQHLWVGAVDFIVIYVVAPSFVGRQQQVTARRSFHIFFEVNKAWSAVDCNRRCSTRRNFYLVNYDFVRTIFWLNTRDITALHSFAPNWVNESFKIIIISPPPALFAAARYVFPYAARSHQTTYYMFTAAAPQLSRLFSICGIFVHLCISDLNLNDMSESADAEELFSLKMAFGHQTRKLRLKSDNEHFSRCFPCAYW